MVGASCHAPGRLFLADLARRAAGRRLCLVFTYPLTAGDLFDYLALGHLTVFHDANPFTQFPGQFAFDPFVRYAAWRFFPSAYGPALGDHGCLTGALWPRAISGLASC
ncbi:hypothetical protein [Candidatus Amarolinea dominans]|uniref:hypothetical protein n=1 Tax=Candidatus Amarolinea dominans TaxID=3140696 RepID=UPI003136585C|nr:hypothetical protein [Anaerolineae bacterium]